jgi:hypothetical protein
VYRRYPRKLGGLIEDVADETLDAWRSQQITQEPDITSWLMSAIDSRLKSREVDGIKVETKVFSSSGLAAEESRTGADFANVLEISFPGFEIRKAFIAQAKKISRRHLDSRDVMRELMKDSKLESQCGKLLAITPASFVFVYKPDGCAVFPALDVGALFAGSRRRPETYLHHKSIGAFYEDFFKTFIGDHPVALRVDDMGKLDSFARGYELPHALYLRIAPRTDLQMR